jgi:hypothetical protein
MGETNSSQRRRVLAERFDRRAVEVAARRASRRPPRTPRQWAGTAALALLGTGVFKVVYAGTGVVLFNFAAVVSVLVLSVSAFVAVATWGLLAMRDQ